MLTIREAKQRASLYGIRLQWQSEYQEWRVTLEHWTRKQSEAREYFTSCVEDALSTGMTMARLETKAA